MTPCSGRNLHDPLDNPHIPASAYSRWRLLLAYANGAIVRLDYLVGSEQVHLSSALLGAAVIGWLLGLVSSFIVVFRLRRERRAAQALHAGGRSRNPQPAQRAVQE